MIVIVVVLAIVVAGAALRPSWTRRQQTSAAPAPTRAHALAIAWRRHRRRRAPTARAAAEWCDSVARCVRSGSTLRDALASTSVDDPAVDRALAPVKLALERGLAVTDAVVRAEVPGPHVHLALSVISTTSRIGGPSAAAIERTAMALRQRAADLEERAVHAAQARLSTHVLTAVPLAMLGVLVVADHDVRAVVLSGLGAVCVGVGLALNATGWWWMRRIVRGAP